MRAAFILAALALLAPSAHAVTTGSAAIEPPLELEADAADEDAVDDDDGALAEDAPELQEDLTEGKQELEELLRAEEQVIDSVEAEAQGRFRLGLTNPLRLRADDALQRHEALPAALQPPPEGDAGALVAELAGIDMATLKASYDIPIEINDEVISYLRFFQGTGRKWFERWLARSERWIPYMRPILAEEGVPLDLVYLSMIESGFSMYAYSWARASGPWQFISATGRRYGLRDDFWVDERRDPAMATRSAARYLRTLHREFGDWYLAWAGYNAGEGKMRRAIRMYGTRDFWELCEAGRYLRKETKHYVPKLIAAAIIAKHPERFGFTNIQGEEPFEYDEVEVPDATDLEVLSKAAGTSVDVLQKLNPSLRRMATPPAHKGKGYSIRIPKGTREEFVAAYEQIPANKRLTYRHYKVQRGDSPGVIARRYGVSADELMRVNGVKNARSLRIGQDLIIPIAMQASGSYPGSTTTTASSGSKSTATKAKATQARKVTPAKTSSGGRKYVVRKGDTLWSIARQFGVAVDDLKRWNGIGGRGHKTLKVGQALQVSPPGKAKRASNG